MIEINLLPKDYRKGGAGFSLGKSGVYIMAGVVGMMAIFVAITFYQMNQLDSLKVNIAKANQRAELLQDDIKIVDGLIGVKSKVRRRIKAVEELDRHRSAWVRILEDISRNTPDFVWLVKFKEIIPDENKVGNVDTAAFVSGSPPPFRPVEIEGYTFTLNALAAMMIKMMRSDYFDAVELVLSEDKKISGEKAYNFMLSANVHYLSDEELRNLVAQADTPGKSKSSHKTLN